MRALFFGVSIRALDVRKLPEPGYLRFTKTGLWSFTYYHNLQAETGMVVNVRASPPEMPQRPKASAVDLPSGRQSKAKASAELSKPEIKNT